MTQVRVCVETRKDLKAILADVAVEYIGGNGHLVFAGAQRIDAVATYIANLTSPPSVETVVLPGFGVASLAPPAGGRGVANFKNFLRSQLGQRDRAVIVLERTPVCVFARAAFTKEQAAEYTAFCNGEDQYVPLEQGEYVGALETDGLWTNVERDDETVGWVPTSCLEW